MIWYATNNSNKSLVKDREKTGIFSMSQLSSLTHLDLEGKF